MDYSRASGQEANGCVQPAFLVFFRNGNGAAVALFFLGSLYYQRSHETTLQGLYAQDFETAYKFGPSGPIPFQLGGKRYSIEAVIPFDTDSRSYFLSFYVPRSSASYENVLLLARIYVSNHGTVAKIHI
jgi:hypothetical protein